MQTQEIRFTVTKQDFRFANYYIWFLSRTIGLYVCGGTFILFVIYMVLVRLGIVPFWIPSGYIASGAVFWLLWQVSKVEISIRKYAKSPNSILGKKTILRFTDSRMSVKIPEKAFNSSGLIADYPCAFETRFAFLVYTSGADLFLIPQRAFKPETKSLFRDILIRTMGDRFDSRFNKNAPHIPTAAELEAKEVSKAKAEQEAAAKEAEKAHKKAVLEARKEGRDLIAEERAAAEEAAAVKGPNYRPHRNSIADRANLVTYREKNVEKKN